MYLEGMEEASIFVHVAISDISGKVSVVWEQAVPGGRPWKRSPHREPARLPPLPHVGTVVLAQEPANADL